MYKSDPSILTGLEFDEESTETIDNATYEIGWIKVMYCDEAMSSAQFKYLGPNGESDISELETLAPYAISVKIVPDESDGLTQEEFDDLAIYTKPCTDPVVAMNELNQMYGADSSKYYGTDTALNQLGPVCSFGINKAFPASLLCTSNGGIHLNDGYFCVFDWAFPRNGKKVAMYFGFDKGKENICDGTKDVGSFLQIAETCTALTTCDMDSRFYDINKRIDNLRIPDRYLLPIINIELKDLLIIALVVVNIILLSCICCKSVFGKINASKQYKTVSIYSSDEDKPIN